jgi:hypothetical protein
MGTMAAQPFKIGLCGTGKTAGVFFMRSSPRRRPAGPGALAEACLTSRLRPGVGSWCRKFQPVVGYGIANSRCYGPQQERRITEIPEARDDTPGRLPRPDACLPTARRPDEGLERHLSFLLLTTF